MDGSLKWSFDTGDAIESSPVIGVDGTIYIGSHNGILYAINPDGSEKWRFDAGPPIYDVRWNVSKSMMATPAIAEDGTIYIYSSANYLFALNPDGSEKWRFYVKWGNDFWSSPTIGSDGTIFIGSARSQEDKDYEGGLHAINPDGTEKWLFSDDSGVTSTAAIGSDGHIYFGGNIAHPSGQGNLGIIYALKPNGEQIWNYTTEAWMESSPLIADDGIIYSGSGRDARVYTLDGDGSLKWFFQAEVGLSSVPILGVDGTVYVGAWDCNMYALNPGGSVIWKYKTPDAFEGIISSPAIGSEGTIYVGSNSGNFYAFYPNGSVKWTFETKGSGIVSSPAIGADGTIYFGSWNHKLYAIGGPGETLIKDENTKRQAILIANSIDGENIEGLRESYHRREFKLKDIKPVDFDEYRRESFIVILGGHNAPEGVDRIVSQLLDEDEKKYLEDEWSASKVFIKKDVWTEGQRIFIFAGHEASQTRQAWINSINREQGYEQHNKIY